MQVNKINKRVLNIIYLDIKFTYWWRNNRRIWNQRRFNDEVIPNLKNYFCPNNSLLSKNKNLSNDMANLLYLGLYQKI